MAEIDKGQMSQVVHNLVLNADQAMPEGGVIRIFAENYNHDTKHMDHAVTLQNGTYLKISFQDEGIGISEKHLSQIFDPYFTTKHRGNGLGLSTTYSIVKKHGGVISVQSQIGIGTTFTIYLPASDIQFKSNKKPMEQSSFNFKGIKVLVMDDEESIREVAGHMLIHLGCEVDFAKDGQETMKCFQNARDQQSPFDVIIMDLTIPGGMGGKETIRELRKIDDRVKTIVSSGYSGDPIMSDYRKNGFDGVIAKPYRINDLSKLLQEILVPTHYRNQELI